MGHEEDHIETARVIGYSINVKTIRYVYWEEDGAWLGYLEDYPDYMTQGETLEELRENLQDIFKDVTNGHIPGVRRIAKLQIA